MPEVGNRRVQLFIDPFRKLMMNPGRGRVAALERHPAWTSNARFAGLTGKPVPLAGAPPDPSRKAWPVQPIRRSQPCLMPAGCP
jgi:hypothetical protein